jgi:oligopeptide transport system ATP-binding protein
LSETSDIVLEVRDLATEFVTEEGVARVVDGVSWTARRGEILAIVGESGCGKSVSALSIMRLIPSPPGRIVGGQAILHGANGKAPQDLLSIPESAMRRVRGARVAMIFQEPMSALNPVMTIGAQIVEGIRLHKGLGRRAAYAEAVELLRQVGIPAPDKRVHDYPHLLSGGMRQRAMIAMALSCDPDVLIADEPTTALDVTVQAQILELLVDIRDLTGMAVVLITHDLGVVAETADRVCVMYAGRVVETGVAREVFANPLHPYTRGLLESVPRPDRGVERLRVIPGRVPDPLSFPPGCRFHPRCDLTRDRATGDRNLTPMPSDDTQNDDTQNSENAVSILARCVKSTDGESGGDPRLREVETDRGVACWEAPGYGGGSGDK